MVRGRSRQSGPDLDPGQINCRRPDDDRGNGHVIILLITLIEIIVPALQIGQQYTLVQT